MLNVPEAVVLVRIQFSLAVRLQRPVGENSPIRTLSRLATLRADHLRLRWRFRDNNRMEFSRFQKRNSDLLIGLL